jgi:hypothetical protein
MADESVQYSRRPVDNQLNGLSPQFITVCARGANKETSVNKADRDVEYPPNVQPPWPVFLIEKPSTATSTAFVAASITNASTRVSS